MNESFMRFYLYFRMIRAVLLRAQWWDSRRGKSVEEIDERITHERRRQATKIDIRFHEGGQIAGHSPQLFPWNRNEKRTRAREKRALFIVRRLAE